MQRALKALSESQSALKQHSCDLAKLIQAGPCVRLAMIINWKLREDLAQGRREVIWAQDRIRFGRDEVGVQPIDLQKIEVSREDLNMSLSSGKPPTSEILYR